MSPAGRREMGETQEIERNKKERAKENEMRRGKNDHLLVDARPLHRIMSVCFYSHMNNEQSNDLQCWHNKQFRCVSNCVPSTSPSFMGRRWHWTLKRLHDKPRTTHWQHAHCLHADKLSNLPNFPNDWLQMLSRRTRPMTTCDKPTMHSRTRWLDTVNAPARWALGAKDRETERQRDTSRRTSNLPRLPDTDDNEYLDAREEEKKRHLCNHLAS